METAPVNVLARFIRLLDGERPCLDGELVGLVRSLHLCHLNAIWQRHRRKGEENLPLVGPKYSLVFAGAELPAY